MTTESTAKIVTREQVNQAITGLWTAANEHGINQEGNRWFARGTCPYAARIEPAKKQAEEHRDAILAAYDALLAERDDLQIENDGISAANRSLIDRVHDLEAENADLRNCIRDEEAMRNINEAFAYRPIRNGLAAVRAWLAEYRPPVADVLADPDNHAILAVLTAATFAASLAAGWIARRR